MRRAFLLLVIFLLSGIPIANQSQEVPDESGVEWVKFDLPKDSIRNFVGHLDESLSLEERPLIAHSRLGIHDSSGIMFEHDIPDELLVSRPDLKLILVSTEFRLAEVRAEISEQNGVEVREFISPSGLLVQGTQAGLSRLVDVGGIASIQPVPLALLVDFSVMDAEETTPVRIESWRADTLLPGVDISDNWGMRLHQELDSVANGFLADSYFAETGRYDGQLSSAIASIAAEPSVAWVGLQPSLTIWNDQARSHMNINAMKQYYTTDLDGSGQIVAVADSGLDEDHGDFGTRVIGNVDIIGDGSTADAHSGHGTHVACTVLGDGTRGNYAGVAPEAELYFQAMENDNNGNFQWSSINNMLNTAYNNGARTHTNSWGSESSSEWGVYTSSSEDVDDRARYYDQFYSGREGLTILFAAGNDGPDSDTIGSPATAKNLLAVGNSQNRYSGAPNSIMDGSSRGPVDDGRIKPDVIAPGGYVRSCKAQEATDTSGATWTNTWYMEYTGTSMATPNAAGTAALIREYITEIAQRPEPQGALVKAMMILGARDVGSRDIPNNDEGWGRIDLKATLAPSNGRGIWVDDRSTLSASGNSKSYSFNVTTSGQPFKAVIAWSDERGSRFSNTQLVNNLNLLVTTPSGVEYKGNEFSQGRSIQGGTHDSLNNVEVVLVDSAEAGLWTVKVIDANHNGGRAQPFAVAVSGVGVNDLRPDPSPIASSFSKDIAIPQVGDDVLVEMTVSNLGNVKAENVEVVFQEEGLAIDTKTFDIGPGGAKNLFWDWQPQNAGQRTLSFIIDSNDDIDEINEANNRMDVIVNVTTPGVRIESESATYSLSNINATTSSWQVTLINTALLSTNASISANGVTGPDASPVSWYVGLDESNFMLDGQQGALVNVTLVHPQGPDPGLYEIELLGYDEDNDVSSPFTLMLDVPELAETRLEFDYTKIPVNPTDVTSVNFRLFNLGNSDLGYDLFLESPPGWYSGFDDLSAQGGANSASTGLMLEDGQINLAISFTPPQVMTLAGAEMTVILRVVSQSDEARIMQYELPLIVEDVTDLNVDLETSFTSISTGTTLLLQYTIENVGNTNLELNPRMQLPQGWTQNTQLEDFTLNWTESRNFVISLTAESDARSGQISFIFDSNQGSWTNSKDVEVFALPDPLLTFTTVEIAGETWTNIFGPGKHPTGVPINYTWLVENRESTPWSPTVVLQKDSNLLGDCTELGVVNKGDLKPLTCTIIISGSADPNSEPQFNLVLSDNTVIVNESVSMLVAASKELDWEIDGPRTLQTGQTSTLEITITNTGNALLSGAVKAKPSSGWSVSISGSESLNLQAGESQKLRLDVTANKPGKGTISLSISGASEVANSETEIELASEGESSDDSSSAVEILFWAVWIIIPILAVFAVVILKKKPGISSNGQNLTQNYQTTQTNQQSNVIPCFLCRQPILSQMRGCPSCGARYHSTCEVGNCTHCGAPSSAFLIVE